MKHYLALEDISLSINGRSILSGISLTVNHGEHWAVLGPNGSGKTSLVNIIMAYTWPTRGAVEVLGDRYGTVDIRKKRRKIGLVSSSLFERIPPRETLRDVILSGRFASLGIYDEPDSSDYEKADEIMEFLHCESIADIRYGVLSFGERQLALIGRALAAEPELLILDEPFEGLDISARELMLSRLDTLAAERNSLAIILVTHRVEEIPPGFTHALILKEGSILESGLKGAVITSANLTAAMDTSIEILSRNGRFYAVAAWK